MESNDKDSSLQELFTYQSAAPAASDTLLALQLGDRYASYALKDRQQGQLLALGYLQIANWNQSSFDQLMGIFDKWLSPQQGVEIAFDMQNLSVLPVAGYEEKKLQALHQSLFPFDNTAVFKTETMAEWQLQLGYTLPAVLLQGCLSRFAGARVRHAFKLALDTAGQSGAAGKLLIDIGMETFRVLLLKNNRLQLFQTYPYASPADVLYYLLSICEAQLVSPVEVSVVLTGLFEQDSALYKELWQYFTQVELREAGFMADDLSFPQHYFTTLNDLLLCAL
ncbi:MAG: DUF3822 family protein [Sphingomonadales bacterium]